MSKNKYNRVNFRTQKKESVQTNGFAIGTHVIIDGKDLGIVTVQAFPKSCILLSDGSNAWIINDRIEVR